MNTPIHSADAPEPVGAYPHARRVGDLLFLSGVGPRSPLDNSVPGHVLDKDGRLINHDIAAQCEQVFANVRIILAASGASWKDLIDVTVFLTDMAQDFEIYNDCYRRAFADVDCCRTTVGVDSLPTPIHIELKCIAAIGAGRSGS